jgi:hypothetical protein
MSMEVATIILNQIGKAAIMAVGAKGFVGGKNLLQFFVKAPKPGKYKIRIVLEPDDTYSVEWGKIVGFEWKQIQKTYNIYCDQLSALMWDVVLEGVWGY